MPQGWQLLVKADSVVSSIMSRVSNCSPRGNLSLMSPACLTVFTGHREKCNQWSDFPENQQSWGMKKHPAKEMPLAQKPGSSCHTRDQVHSTHGVMQMCVFWVSVFCKYLWKTIKLLSQYFQITAQAADSFPVCGLSTSSKVTLPVWRASHPHMTPSSSHHWEHLIYTWFGYAYMKSQKLY